MALLEWQPVDLRSDPHAFEHQGDPADMIDALVFLGELRPAWHADALCRASPDGDTSPTFFPGKGEPAGPAKALCQRCPVLDECRAYALEHTDLQGIWGGTSSRERVRLRAGAVRRVKPLSPCGTFGAYARHRKLGESPCEACAAAHRRYMADYRARRAS